MSPTDTNSTIQKTKSSPNIESICQIKKKKDKGKMVNNGSSIEQSTHGEFVIEDLDMIHFLCKLSRECFPEPRVLFYNKEGKRMQNNENIQIRKPSFYPEYIL